MDDTRALHLQHGRKVCYFDCLRQFLPEHHPFQRNKKVVTKNRVENKGKTKDNINARRNFEIICNRPELELDEHRSNVMPKAVYKLANEQKRRVWEWIRDLKFLDGYASNVACCFDMMELRMHDMKGHDRHLFM
ncbi:hypothetical protein Sango_2718000 [Sesamum angolense]|uniref:Uncharacterized protein n=1 Tax=Sesamum angolense TaxID=2727404 RepID=A0AAE2BHW4_9LAMI|nr:hypothetical protein Sango_2718000 [Sesamum angolense]